MLIQHVNITDFVRFATSDMSTARGNEETEPTKHTTNCGGSDCDNVERRLYNNSNNNNTFIGESLRMGKSSLGKRKTSVCPLRYSSLGPVGEVPEQSVRK
jgi:hypothetical protein